ncbi:hypothetical protein [Chroococcidiopsis sp.]|uniref:hypothetical protein n=1 Tax=Chroococcidiopsis sp. TaxID=3088168 RepID=UPI003F30DC5B
MTVSTRTFPVTLTSATANTVIEIVHFRDEPLLTGEKAAVYLEAAFCNVSLKSFQLMRFPDYEGDESDAERLSLFTAAELASQKIGLRILSRKSNTGTWREKAEVILTNAGRKSYFDLLIPYLAKAQVRLLEYNDAIGIQLIDYGNGLLKQNDFIEIEFAVTVDISKKNDDFEQLSARISSLELALEGKLVNLPANTLLGRNATTGTAQPILQSTFAKPADIDTAIFNLIGAAPAALNTLDELANAISDDQNFAATITNSLTSKYNALAYNSSFNPNNFISGIQGADADLGEGLRGWHFITNIRSTSVNFGFQLAFCDTSSLCKFREKISGQWEAWKIIACGESIAVKYKVLSGVTAANSGETVTLPHGLTPGNIISISGVIFYAANATVPICGTQSQYATVIASDAININVTNVANNSAGIYSKPLKLLVWYIG